MADQPKAIENLMTEDRLFPPSDEFVAAALKGIGYNNVVDLEGGFEDWLETGNTFYNLHGEHRVVSYGAEE